MLGVGPVSWKPAGEGITIEIPPLSVAELPCHHAWVLKLTELQNID